MTSTAPRGVRAPAVTDALLIAVGLAVALRSDALALRLPLLVAIPVVLAWGLATLHFPARVELDGDGIAFHRYGRVHRFAWSEVTKVRVRRFLVRDRVLVRLEPSPPFRGRYWLTDAMTGFDALVAALEARARVTR